MCLASKYVSEMDDLFNSINADIRKLSKKQSEHDKKLSDMYHKLETLKFNACEGYYIAKEFQEIAQKRRLIKSELFRLQMLSKTLKINDINSRIPKVKEEVIKSNQLSKEWLENFPFNFSDIQEEILQ